MQSIQAASCAYSYPNGSGAQGHNSEANCRLSMTITVEQLLRHEKPQKAQMIFWFVRFVPFVAHRIVKKDRHIVSREPNPT